MPEIINLLFSFIFILILIFGVFYAIKWLNKRVAINSTKNMKILERINLGQDKMIILVDICGKYMLLGVSSQHVEKICDISPDDVKNNLLKSDDIQTSVFLKNFKEILTNKREKK